jgi:hypothetical protein
MGVFQYDIKKSLRNDLESTRFFLLYFGFFRIELIKKKKYENIMFAIADYPFYLAINN